MQEFKDAFKNYMTLLVAEFAEGLVDWSLGAITFSASEWVGNCFNIISGDEYENEMDELFYLNFQNEIFSTFYEITEKYPNVLQSHYTVEEIKDLTDLTLLYLRCGQLGFNIYYPSHADACAEAYRELQQMEFPWIEEGGTAAAVTANVSAHDYNVPGTISKGDYYVIFGVVSSAETIKSVKAEVTGANGYLCASADNVNSKEFDIAVLDAQMRFNDLMPGDYIYQVTVTTESGEHKLISSDFQVNPEDGQMTIVGYRLPHTMNVGDVFYVTGREQ